jgi:aspartate/methionine/tyrosine aminotransferase
VEARVVLELGSRKPDFPFPRTRMDKAAQKCQERGNVHQTEMQTCPGVAESVQEDLTMSNNKGEEWN